MARRPIPLARPRMRLLGMLYVTNITINGVQVQVALDTGSTDLWVIPPGGIGQFNDTGISLELLYGDGSYGTKGTIGVAPFTFGPYKIDQQAFMNAVESNIGLMQDSGIYGLMGLSFDFSSASPINQKIKSLYGPDATWGRSVLRNIFAQNPTEPNFIAIDLSRTGDLEDTSGGSFAIGEYEDKYAAVANKTKLTQYPYGGDRWTTLLEGIYVDGTAINVQSTIPSVPAGQAQAMLDTGDPSSIFPTAILDAIYSRVPRAALYSDATGRVWVIPCNTTTHVELVFGSERYAIHPLDLSTISDPLTIDGQQYVACVSSFKGADNWGAGDFDISLGDTFLRNVYSVFDFGDTLANGSTGDPYMQLLSKIDPAKAIAQVASIRGQTMASLPPELDPATLVALLTGLSPDPTTTNGIVSPSATDSSTLPDSTSAAGDSSDSSSKGSGPSNAGNNLLSANDNGGITVDESTVKHYGLIIVCLLSANVLLSLVLIVLGIMACVRRGSSRKNATRAGAPHYVPVKNAVDPQDEAYSGGYQKTYVR
ncbi:aspartic peptidase domain-containing protein [Flammula alnicola]|nr:aspartic peptidase domain-containing protein [Flammula alnicola]